MTNLNTPTEPVSAPTPLMATATYRLTDGSDWKVEYDRLAPCRICALPVIAASMGGTDVCPWCDTGHYRDGSAIELQDHAQPERMRMRAAERTLGNHSMLAHAYEEAGI